MKILKIILLILAVILGGYTIWMATLDGKYNVQRSIIINTTPEMVYAEVSDFKTWPSWSSWFEKDSTMTTTFSDPSNGVGAWYTFESVTEKNSKGRMEIKTAEPNTSIQSIIEFDGMGSSNVNWFFKPVDGGTEVTWTMEGEMPFFFRFLAQSMDAGIGPDYEQSLAKLKVNLESRKPSYSFSEVNLMPMDIFYTHHDMAISDFNEAWYQAEKAKIVSYLGDDMANTTGAMMQVYTLWDEAANKTIFDLAFPVASAKKGTNEILKGQSYAGKCIKTTHYGPYDKLGEAHEAMDEYLKANNLQMGEVVMEVYVTGPKEEQDPANYMTEIYYSLKTE